MDLKILAVVGLFGVMGLISGLAKQMSRLVGIGAGYAAVWRWGAAAGAWAGALTDRWSLAARVGASILLFYAAYALGAWLSHAVLGKVLAGRVGGTVDKAGGLLLGSAKAAAIIFVLLSAALLFEDTLAKANPGLANDLKHSEAASLARRHNIFDAIHPPVLEKLRRAAAALKDPKAVAALAKDPALKKLLEDPELKSLLADGADLSKIMGDPQVKRLLDDPKALERLSRLGESAEALK